MPRTKHLSDRARCCSTSNSACGSICTTRDGAHPIGYRLARLIEQAKDDAEDKRLLYVAATRAKEKLIISGHAKVNSKGNLWPAGLVESLG